MKLSAERNRVVKRVVNRGIAFLVGSSSAYDPISAIPIVVGGLPVALPQDALEKLEKSPSTWVSLCGAKVVRPPPWVTAKGVVHFIGGAFVGAAPHWTYRRFLMSLAERGALVSRGVLA